MRSNTLPQSSAKIFPECARDDLFPFTDITATAGGPGLSSRVTVQNSLSPSNVAADVSTSLSIPLSTDGDMTAFAIPSPPNSPRAPSPKASVPSAFETYPHSYTIALEFVKEKVGTIIGRIRNLPTPVRTDLRLMYESTWEVRDNEVEFIITPRGPNIYVRPCYQDVYSILNERWRGEKEEGFGITSCCALITGTPGIGKSVFGCFLAKKLMQRQKPALVLYKPLHCEFTKFFWQGVCYMVSNTDAIDLINSVIERGDLFSQTSHDEDKMEIWSIGDAQIPFDVACINQVCISSPGKAEDSSSQIKTWVKNNNAITLTMPPCEWNEMVHIREAIFGDSADEKCPLAPLRERFTKWGGVPRTLLLKPKSLETAEIKFRQLKIADVLPFLGTASLDHHRHSGTIFHLLPAFKMTEGKSWSSLFEKYAEGPSYWWATDTLERQSWFQFRSEQEAAVIDFIETLSNDPACRGRAWENLMHHYIEVAGLRGSLRNLETGEVTNDFVISRTAGNFFKFLTEIDLSAEYWRPVDSQHKTCDSYQPSSGIMFQMTIGKEHPINISGLEGVLQSNIFQPWQKLNPDQKLKMIFVVHNSVFKEFSKQSYKYNDVDPNGNSKNAANTKSKNTPAVKEQRKNFVENKVTQYVLEVDLGPKLRSLRQSVKKRGRDDYESDESDKESEQRRQKAMRVSENESSYCIHSS